MTDPSRPRIYVAGPISKGDVRANVQAGIDAGLRLLTAGFAPLIPHLSALVPAEAAAVVGSPRYEDWMETDFAWIEVADALVRIPGDSAGADREVIHAAKYAVPVFYLDPADRDPFADLLARLREHFSIEETP